MSDTYDRFTRIAEILNCETLINEFYRYLNVDERESFVKHIERMYDIAEEEDEEDEGVEEEYEEDVEDVEEEY